VQASILLTQLRSKASQLIIQMLKAHAPAAILLTNLS
jgi:hypothetical protein